MEKQLIESMTASLPIITLEQIPEPEQVWEEWDGEAFFIVSRRLIGAKNITLEAIAITISGPPPERERIRTEFSEVFGAPTDMQINPLEQNNIDSVLWISVH